jgi:hypothetical protein
VFSQLVPNMRVAPALFLQTGEGACLRITAPPDFPIPEAEHRAQHFRDMAKAADALLKDVERRLGFRPPIRKLVDHYSDKKAFASLPGVARDTREADGERYFVVTGEATHFLRKKPTFPRCPYHGWERSEREGKAHGVSAVSRPSVSPRALFVSGEPQHCSRSDVFVAKRQPITAENEALCGLRSRGHGHAFCELWPIDSMVCCRTCCFEKACDREDGPLGLPCRGGAGRAHPRRPKGAPPSRNPPLASRARRGRRRGGSA